MPAKSQQYLSTRGGSYGLSFEEVVLKGLADDGGLFIPSEIPSLPANWFQTWSKLSFQELAVEIFSLFISPEEIPLQDLQELVNRSYSTFRHKDIAPLRPLVPEEKLYLLELFHGPTFAFKDVALQFLGNLFGYFLKRKNKGVGERERDDGQRQRRHHLTVLGATSGDTGSAAIYGLRGKKDVSVFILHPKGRVSPIQEAQMTSVLDSNVHNVAVEGTFDDCQDVVKALFSDPTFNKDHHLAAVNSINWARILAQIVYYFSSYFTLLSEIQSNSPEPAAEIHYIVPTGNFGDVLAGYYAKKMGLPIARLHIATNENDILDRYLKSGSYSKNPVYGKEAEGGRPENGVKADPKGVKETLSPAMDILVSSNFERLLWHLAKETSTGTSTGEDKRAEAIAGEIIKTYMSHLKASSSFTVSPEILEATKKDFSSDRVDDESTAATIKKLFLETEGKYILDPHSAVGVGASLRVAQHYRDSGSQKEGRYFISLATAHPAKFSHAVDLALQDVESYEGFEKMVRPKEFVGLEGKEKRCVFVERGKGEGVSEVQEKVKRVLREELAKEQV